MTKTPHELLVQLAAVTPGQTLVDLGCARGATLKLLAHPTPDTQLVGVDLNPDTLTAVRRVIPGAAVVLADLARLLPFADASTDVAVCHNTLECLADPRWLLAEIARVLRPGGRAVLGHTDFETIVVTSADRDLSRRVCLTYAQLPVRYRQMANADPQLGRRLPAWCAAARCGSKTSTRTCRSPWSWPGRHGRGSRRWQRRSDVRPCSDSAM